MLSHAVVGDIADRGGGVARLYRRHAALGELGLAGAELDDVRRGLHALASGSTAGAVTGAGAGTGMPGATSAVADSSSRGALTERDRVANASANARSTASTLASRAAASTSVTN